MSKRFTDTDKYKKRFIRSLPAAYKILWDYLYHECDFAGIWHVDFEVVKLRIGFDAPVDPDEALRLFNADEERIVVLNGGSKWFIRPFLDFQYGTLNVKNRVHFSVINVLLRNGIKDLTSPLEGAKDKDKDKAKDKDLRSENALDGAHARDINNTSAPIYACAPAGAKEKTSKRAECLSWPKPDEPFKGTQSV